MATQNSSSDMSFYIIMLALIAGMAFYISNDMEKRYASAETAQPASEPVVISVAETGSVVIKPIVDIPATETTPEAVIVKKVEQKTIVTTALVPVKEEVSVAELEPFVIAQPKSTPAPAPAASIVETMINTVEQATSPMVEAVTEAVQPEAAVTKPMADAYQQGYRDGFSKGYQKASRQQYGNSYNNYGYPYQR